MKDICRKETAEEVISLFINIVSFKLLTLFLLLQLPMERSSVFTVTRVFLPSAHGLITVVSY
jgi:hypothetical protein